MNLNDITIVCAVDAKYIEKAQIAYRSWLYYKPEIAEMPLLMIYDASQLAEKDKAFNVFRKHKGFLPFPWACRKSETQREKMLTSLVYVPSAITTPWYLKLDADTIASAKGPWIKDEWFEKKGEHLPAFVSNPWGYTKPAEYFDKMEEWGDTVPDLAKHVKLSEDPAYRVDRRPVRTYYSRIISWLCFGNTEFTRYAASLCPSGKLPVPSQDTYLHYVAQRLQRPYSRIRFSKLGWQHCGAKSVGVMREMCAEALK